jgi:hypothetical protein
LRWAEVLKEQRPRDRAAASSHRGANGSLVGAGLRLPSGVL